LFAGQWRIWVLGGLLVMLAFIVSMASLVPLWFWLMESVNEGYRYGNWLSPLLWVGVAVFLIGSVLSTFLYAGLYKMAERQLLGQPIRLEDLFSVSDRVLPLIAVQGIVFPLVLAGTFLCLIPGLVIAGLMFFITPAVVLGKRGVVEAMRESYRLVTADTVNMIIFGFVTNLIAGSGSQVCYIGLVVSLPLSVLITTIAYFECTRNTSAVGHLAAPRLQ